MLNYPFRNQSTQPVECMMMFYNMDTKKWQYVTEHKAKVQIEISAPNPEGTHELTAKLASDQTVLLSANLGQTSKIHKATDTFINLKYASKTYGFRFSSADITSQFYKTLSNFKNISVESLEKTHTLCSSKSNKTISMKGWFKSSKKSTKTKDTVSELSADLASHPMSEPIRATAEESRSTSNIALVPNTTNPSPLFGNTPPNEDTNLEEESKVPAAPVPPPPPPAPPAPVAAIPPPIPPPTTIKSNNDTTESKPAAASNDRGGGGGGMDLASALGGVKLRKRPEPTEAVVSQPNKSAAPLPSNAGGGDMMSEIAAKLLKRKLLEEAEEANPEPVINYKKPVVIQEPEKKFIPTPKPALSVNKNRADSNIETKFLKKSFQPEKVDSPTISNDSFKKELNDFKTSILKEIIDELNKMKLEIIQELKKSAN